MLPDAIELIIVTPVRELLRESVVEVQLPGADGYLGVLPGAAPLITELGIGELTFHSKTGGAASDPIAIVRGFAEVLPDRVTVLAETAELASEIDVARAEAALKRAQERMASNAPDLDWDRATAALQRALIRIQVARRHRGVPVAST
ncbi:MAG: F0F1 ATP synthase subunit epsilon [Candidatus Acidiferrum sp.]